MMCGKIKYTSRSEAFDSIIGISKDKRPHRSKKQPVQPYYCHECKAWHMTSNKNRMKTVKQTTSEIRTTPRPQRAILRIINFAVVLLFISCNFIDDQHQYVDPILKPHFENFFNQAEIHGVLLYKPENYSIALIKGLENEEGVWGRSFRDNDIKIIYMDYDRVINWHNKGNFMSIERLLFHEMGHSILLRRHTGGYSVMNDTDYFDDYVRFDDRRAELREELFSRFGN